jgi:RecQ-mediated genome instability protein 1
VHFDASIIVSRNAMTLQTQIVAHFASKQLFLSQAYISNLLTSLRPPPTSITPPVLAKFHTYFLESFLQQSAAPESLLPHSVPTLHNVTVAGPTLVQVIKVYDIGTSRLAQLEALEKAITEAGPQGLRVVDLPAEEENENNAVQNRVNDGISVGKSTCKVLLEDGRGERVYGMEVKSIEGIKVGMSLGCKVRRPYF